MKIGIILHPYGEKKPAGLGRYIFNLSKELIEKYPNQDFIIYTKGEQSKPPEFQGNNWTWVPLGFGRLWMEIGLFFAPKADVYIFNTPVMPLLFKPKKTIVIALDFAYKYLKPGKNSEKLINFMLYSSNKRALKKADKIVSISEATKIDTVKFFGVSEDKNAVIYPGFNKMCDLTAEQVDAPHIFFLYVGVIKERKNLLNIVKGFCDFKKRILSDCKLVVCGKGGGYYYEEVMSFVENNNLADDVVFLDFVSDSQLSFLYKKAAALVFPSLVEGFGFPVLEAMDCGLPVITSARGSLEEIAGNAGILVDPESHEEISAAMEKIYRDESLRKKMAEAGRERAKNFSWGDCAEKFMKEILKI